MLYLSSKEEAYLNTLPINSIINGKCVSEMKKLPDSYIDLIIADPPYTLSKGLKHGLPKPREYLSRLIPCGFLAHIVIWDLSMSFAKCSELKSLMKSYGIKEMFSPIWREDAAGRITHTLKTNFAE